MPRASSSIAVNPWKMSTFVLVAALAAIVSRDAVPSAEAAGPRRLSAALSALKSSQKQLEEAKDPPAPFHAQSMLMVKQAITAVEREIKAYNDLEAKQKAKEAKDGKDGKKDDKKDEKKKEKKEEKPKKAVTHDSEE
jgi:hypothetical protein